MFLKILTACALLVHGISVFALAPENRLIAKCVKECERQTETHFMEVYGGICDPDTKNGQRLLARMEQYDEIMEAKGVRYADDKKCTEITTKSGKSATKHRCKDPAERGSGCDPDHLRKISRFDQFNNSTNFKTQNKEKKELNGTLAKGERSPFDYGTVCVAQCRDPDGTISGRDMDAEQIYVPSHKRKVDGDENLKQKELK